MPGNKICNPKVKIFIPMCADEKKIFLGKIPKNIVQVGKKTFDEVTKCRLKHTL